MDERRARPERRTLLPRLTPGRRITDPPDGHGLLRTYKGGCRCFRCRVANARYENNRRQRVARDGWTAYGWAIEARRRVRQLEIEGYPKSRIAKLAGWRDGRGYHVDIERGQMIRRTTLDRILRVAQYAMLEGVDIPTGQEASGV